MKNGSIKNIKKEVLSENWYILNKYTYDYQKEDGSWEEHQREAYDRGNGAAILLYNARKNTVILTRQFRMPTYVNGNETGMMIEVCAGLLDGDHPEECIKKEVEEETGYAVHDVAKSFRMLHVSRVGHRNLIFLSRRVRRNNESRRGRRSPE